MCNVVSNVLKNKTLGDNPTVIEVFQASTKKITPDVNLDLNPRKVDELARTRTLSSSRYTTRIWTKFSRLALS